MWVCTALLAALTVGRGGQAVLLRDVAEPSAPAQTEILSEAFVSAVREHAGLYNDKLAHPEFSGTVLVTASNIAYEPLLKNWRCHADRLGLDYVVIAFDPQLVKGEAKDGRVLYMDGANFAEHAKFRQGHFNEMSCMKIRIVQEIMARTGLSVVFSDPDNTFRSDPFAADVSLGQKMRSGMYEYVYQQNHGRRNMPNSSDLGAEVEEGNTGFYFVAGSRKVEGVQAMFKAALTMCKRMPAFDDQTNFWMALRAIRQGTGRKKFGAGNFACASLCSKGKTCTAPEEEVLNYCEMDPWNHATGWELGAYKGEKKIVTYHGNFIGGGMNNKIGKINRNGFWDVQCAGPVPP